MKIKLFLFLTLIVWVGQAQELPESLTLEEAITYGLTNNRSIINADRDIQKAKKERRKNKDNSGSTRHAFMELCNNAARCLLKHAGYECVYQDCKTSEEQSKCKTQCAHHMLVKIFV